jgi:HAD superfamily hydrolase (TIGR01490 family)
MRHSNKMHFRGVRLGDSKRDEPTQGQPRLAVSRLFSEGVDQVAWHAQQGHSIVLVSGTLTPLAQEIAFALVVRLAVRGIVGSIAVCATRLEERDGRWTGRVVGDAMFGEAKARAVRKIARQEGFVLGLCYAYGDCISDRWMLEAVGRPSAVNPSRKMERLAAKRGWTVLAWTEKRHSAQRPGRTQRSDEGILRPRKSA